jgi:hypothetical protein
MATTLAPACQHRWTSSAISSGVLGRCGVTLLSAIPPVGAMVRITFRIARPVLALPFEGIALLTRHTLESSHA